MIILNFRLKVGMLDGSHMVTFSYMDWSIPNICLTREVAILHYVSYLPSIAAHSREIFRPFRVDLRSFEILS